MNTQAGPNIGATNNCAVASLILSIAFVILGPLGSIPGIICGKIAMKEYKAAGITEGRGMARAGIVIGWIGLILFVLSVIVALVAMNLINEIFESVEGLSQE